MASDSTQNSSAAALSVADKVMMIRGIFNPTYFKDHVRPMIYKKANNDPETVNELVLDMLTQNNLGMSALSVFFATSEKLKITVNGQSIIPFGSAAGLDKNGEALGPLSNFFGFLEPGFVGVNPRPGNEKPRICSDDANLDMYNAQGFPTKGLEYFKNKLVEYRKQNGKKPVYVNICGMPPAGQENPIAIATEEVRLLVKTLAPYADGFVWNCASPNTEALKLLRSPEIARETAKVIKETAPDKLILVKMWPYEKEEKEASLKFVGSFIEGGGHGVVTTNTKMFPKEQIPAPNWGYKSGGRSGKFLKEYRLRSVRDMRQSFPNAIIVAAGGIYDGDDAYETFKAGANMLEGYTPYAFYGLGLLKEIQKGVIRRLEADGYDNLAQLQSDVKQGKHVSMIAGADNIHIDPHVHCRDWDQSYKATIKSVTQTARSQGVVAIVDMPNTQPPITTRALVERRLETARSEGCIDGYYLYIGATADANQIKEAVDVINNNPKVLGMKLYAGKSVGNLEVSSEEGQRTIYKTLAEVGYTGVVMLHCEKESLFKMDLWDPRKPYTWNLARPPEAEVESIKDQIKFAKEYGVKAHLHICHISVPESVSIVDQARSQLSISCGVTPHHITLSTDNMQDESAVVYKVNPPIRDLDSMKKMRQLLKDGKIDFVETDHAPHTKEEKTFSRDKAAGSYMSGITSLDNYSSTIDGLRKDGLSDLQIRSITYSNIKRIFPKITE